MVPTPCIAAGAPEPRAAPTPATQPESIWYMVQQRRSSTLEPRWDMGYGSENRSTPNGPLAPRRPTNRGEDMAVTSVNTKEGVVTLGAEEVGAIPAAEAGAANGVATLDSGMKLTGAQIPTSVATKTEVSAEETRAKEAEKKAREEAEANSDPKGSAATAKGEAEAAATTKVKTEEERAEAAEALLAPKVNAVLAGTPKAPTAAAKTNTEQLATTAFTQTAKAEAETASDKAGAAATAKTEAEAGAKATAEAEVKVEKERAEKAEGEKVAKSEKGAKKGVAELDESQHLVESELPSSVVTGSATGGTPAWQASTKYAVNQLVQSSEVTYICLEAHESGSSFPGAGAKWAPVAGAAVEVSAPAPTGVAATDTANLQAALNAAAGGICKITKPGTYAINKEGLKRPYNASVYLGPNCVLQAAEAIAGPLLTDSKTERSLRQSIVGGGVIDSNNKAWNALWCRYFQRGMTLGVVCENSTRSDCILGDNEATATSDEVFFTSQFACDRRIVAAAPAGGYSLWLQRCTDVGGAPVTLTGQERGVRVDGGNCKFFGLHPYGAEYPMNVMIEDNGLLNEWHGCTVDTPTPVEHAEATGSAASGTITDTAILSQHKGLPVIGANIPAHSYVGTVKPGESFILATSAGVEVKPAGEVKGVKLAGTGWMLREPETRIIGGVAYISTTYGVDDAAYAIVNTSNAANYLVVGLSIRGGDITHRFIKPFVGNVINNSWVNITQQYCIETMGVATRLSSGLGTTLQLVNSATAPFLEVLDQSSNVLAKISSSGQISGAILLPNINTAGKTSAEITTAVEALHYTVAIGLIIMDATNSLILVYSGAKWHKTAALAEIP
jgi:hypothetical protein